MRSTDAINANAIADGDKFPEPRKGIIMAQTFTPKEIAAELQVSPKTFRKFLRSDESGIAGKAPGKGKRWEITRKEQLALSKRFAAWSAKNATAATDEESTDAVEAPEVLEATEAVEATE